MTVTVGIDFQDLRLQRNIAQLDELHKSFNSVEKAALQAVAAQPELAKAIDELTRSFVDGEMSVDSLRQELVAMAGTSGALPKTAAELKKTADEQRKAAEAADKATAALSRNRSEIEKTIEAMRRADGLRGGFWDDNGDRINRFAQGMAGATAAVMGTAAAALAVGAGFVHAAEQGEQNQRAMDALGGAYALVRDATNDTVDAQSAFAARLTLTNSGLRISGQELATVARYARDHRQATETADQALQRLTQSLREGEQGGLRQFGISVSQNATRAMTFESALRQMARANAEGSPVARTFSEDVTRMGSAVVDAGGALASFIGRATGLQGILSSIADRFRQIANDARELTQTTEDQEQQRRSQGQRTTAMQAFGAAQGELGRALDAAGLSRDLMRGLNPGGLTPAQQTALAQRLSAIARQTQGAQAVPVSSDLLVQRTRVGLGAGPRAGGAFSIQGGAVPLSPGDLAADADLDAMAAAVTAGRRGGGIQGQNRALLETALRSILAERNQQAAQNAEAAARAAAPPAQGPRDSAPTGAAASNPMDVLLARIALGRINEQMRTGPFSDLIEAGYRAPRGDAEQATVQDRLQALLRVAEDTGHRLQETELARLQRITAARQAYHDAVIEMLREEAQHRQGIDQKASEAIERNTERQQRLMRQMLSGIERDRSEFGLDVTDADLSAQRSSRFVGDSLGQFFGRMDPEERRRRLMSQQAAYKGAIGSTDQAIAEADSAAAGARTETERLAAEQRRNDLLQQRITLYGQLQQVEQQQMEIDRQNTQYTREFSDAMVGALGSTADAFAGAAVAALEGSKSMGEAMNEMLRGTLKSLAKQSIVEFLKNTAIGFGMLAVGNVPASTNAFAAAGLWAAVGVAAGAGVAAMGPPPEKGKAAAGRSGDTGRAASADKPRGAAEGGGPLVLQINVSGALFNEGVEDAIVQGVDRAAARGVLPRYAQTLQGRD